MPRRYDGRSDSSGQALKRVESHGKGVTLVSSPFLDNDDGGTHGRSDSLEATQLEEV